MDMREQAVRYAMLVIQGPETRDHQQVLDALANNGKYGPWLGDDLLEALSIVREAEQRLGEALPANYA